MAADLLSPEAARAMVAGPVALADWLIVAPVILPMTVGAILLMFRHQVRWQALIAVVGLAATVLADGFLLHRVLEEGPFSMTMGRWLPPFGISFVADALGASFALAAAFVTLVCGVFSMREIDGQGRRYGFYPFLMLLMSGLGGAFLTADIFNLYVWFEVFVIASFGLIILGSERRQVDGATKYAILNLIATTLFLTATAFVYGAFGTLNMADIARKAEGLRATAPLMTIAALYLMSFGMKAAAFPVHFWLPASYHTPPVVTGALFGGLLTKVGVYALLRCLTMLFPVELSNLSGLIGWIAAVTMIFGVLGALAQSDIRRMAGFLVISGIGIMLAGLSLGGPAGLSGTIFYAVHSMLAMSALYLLNGAIRRFGGSFSLRELGGLYRNRPMLAAMALLLFLSVAGLPPGSGLWPKIVLVRAAMELSSPWLAGVILLTGLLTTIALGRVFLLAFWRDRPEIMPAGVSAASHPVFATYAPLLALLIPMLVLGVFPEDFLAVAGIAAGGLLEPSAYIDSVFPAGGR